MSAHRGFTCSFFLAFACFVAAGCHNCDLVEAELRTRENELHEARAEVDRLEALNQALLHEMGDMRQAGCKLPPELAGQTYTIRQVCLGPATGGYDDDKCPGDEALRVVLEPRDVDGHTVKAPGSVHLDVMEISSEGLKTPLSSWDLGELELRRTWRCSLFCTGYVVILPWKTWPTSERLRVVAQFRLADGRLFETDRDVAIRLPPPGFPRPAPASLPGEGPHLLVPDGDRPLPMPHKVSPENNNSDQDDVQPTASWQKPELYSLQNAVHFQRNPEPAEASPPSPGEHTLEDAVRFLPAEPLPLGY
jgi:hypothetical protein